MVPCKTAECFAALSMMRARCIAEAQREQDRRIRAALMTSARLAWEAGIRQMVAERPAHADQERSSTLPYRSNMGLDDGVINRAERDTAEELELARLNDLLRREAEIEDEEELRLNSLSEDGDDPVADVFDDCEKTHFLRHAEVPCVEPTAEHPRSVDGPIEVDPAAEGVS